MKISENELLQAIQSRPTLKPLIGGDRALELWLLPAKFSDSSCSVWRCQVAKTVFIIKIADGDLNSPFWKTMQALFGFSIKDNFIHAKQVYGQIAARSSFKIPDVIDVFNLHSQPVVVLGFIEGQAINAANAGAIEQSLVIDLAHYLAQIHSIKLDGVGCLTHSNTITEKVASNQCKNWFAQLEKSLRKVFAAEFENPLSNQLSKQLDEILAQSVKSLSAVVPIMMDLRWDQFAQIDNRLVGVFDLDAYVAAPIELDFVILEYLLNKEQLAWFGQAYTEAGGKTPNIAGVRDLYRLVFFAMNALGEDDLNQWLSQPHYFD